MKKSIFLFVAIFIVAAFFNSINAQSTASASAAANIVIPIDLQKTADLHFGTMAVLAGTPGTCILSTANVRTSTGGVNLSVQAPTSSNAAFNVSGAISTVYDITLPATITVTSQNLGTPQTMTINSLLAKCASNPGNGVQGTLGGAGTDAFTVGGTLNVAAGQGADIYTGTFNVTVAYN